MEVQTELIRLHEAACQRLPNPVAEHINMYVCRNELVGIIAPDDSMKQMLLDLLACNLQPIAGQRLIFEEVKNGFFGYIVNAQNLFDDMTVTENLLWMSITSKKIIWSEKKAASYAQTILEKYQLGIGSREKISKLSLAEKYMLETVKAIEMLKVKLLIIDNIHLIGHEEQQKILELTAGFRKEGGGVVISSILRPSILQKAVRIYLLQEGCTIRTLFSKENNVYHSHTNMFFSDYMKVTVGALAIEKKHDKQNSDYVLYLQSPGRMIKLLLQFRGTLGLYVSQGFSDADAENLLKTGKWGLEYSGEPVQMKELADLLSYSIGYFPKHVEDIMFYRLNLQENTEIFAYRKLCNFPGILSSRLEKYFMQHCVTADKQTRKATDLSHVKHNVILQTIIGRYQQRTWNLMMIHAPVFIYDTLEYHLMQNFVTDLLNQGTVVILISNDWRLLSHFSYKVIDLSQL